MIHLGISLRDIIHCGKKLGFYAESVKVNIDETHRMPLPAILYFKKGHFVVFEYMCQCKDGYVYSIADPAYGRVKMDEENLIDKWMMNNRGIAIVMDPDGDAPQRHTHHRRPTPGDGAHEGTVKKILGQHKKLCLDSLAHPCGGGNQLGHAVALENHH